MEKRAANVLRFSATICGRSRFHLASPISPAAHLQMIAASVTGAEIFTCHPPKSRRAGQSAVTSPAGSHLLHAFPSAKASCWVFADFAGFMGKLDALLGKFFSAAMFQGAGECEFVLFVFHAGLLLQVNDKEKSNSCM